MKKTIQSNYLKIDINHLNKLLGESKYHDMIEYCENIEKTLKDDIDYGRNIVYLYYYQGIAYSNTDSLELALDCYKKVIEEDPEYLDAYYNIAMLYYNNKNYSDAIEYFEIVNRLNPDEKYETLPNLGTCYRMTEQLGMAKNTYLELLYIINNKKNNTNILFNKDEIYSILGCIVSENLKNHEKLFESLYYFKKSYSLNKNTKSVNNLLSNYGLLCLDNEYIDLSNQVYDNFDKCKTSEEKYLEQKYNILDCYNLIDKDEYSDIRENVLKLFDNDRKYKEEYDKQQFNCSLHYLRIGDYSRGFEYYMKRYINSQWKNNCIPQEIFTKLDYNKLWNGESLINKSIMIICEQGYGDIFQFLRYVSLFHANTKIYIFVKHMKNIKKTLKKMDMLKNAIFIENINPDLEYSYFTFLMSLPYYFKTNLTNIPPPIDSINTDIEVVEKWKSYFSNYKKIKIGFNLFGRGGPNEDVRSVPFSSIENIFNRIDATFFNLNLKKVDDISNSNIVQFSDSLDKDGPFIDTIEIIKNMDYVVTSDTSVAHLAGMFAKRPIMLLKYHAEWRWLLYGDKTAWYPNMKIFRQRVKDGNWDDAIENVINYVNSSKI